MRAGTCSGHRRNRRRSQAGLSGSRRARSARSSAQSRSWSGRSSSALAASAASLPAFLGGFAPAPAASRAVVLAALVLLVHSRPSATLSFLFAYATLLVAFLDMLCLALLFGRVRTTGHLNLHPIVCV